MISGLLITLFVGFVIKREVIDFEMLRGAVEDIELFHTILRDLGDSTRWPQLKSSSEFSAIRAESEMQRAMAPPN